MSLESFMVIIVVSFSYFSAISCIWSVEFTHFRCPGSMNVGGKFYGDDFSELELVFSYFLCL